MKPRNLAGATDAGATGDSIIRATAMAKFDANNLRELRGLREVVIRTEKHPKTAVTIWVVVADDEVFLRSVSGSKGRWPRSCRPHCGWNRVKEPRLPRIPWT